MLRTADIYINPGLSCVHVYDRSVLCVRPGNSNSLSVRDRFLYRVYIIWYRLDSVYRDLTLVLEGLNIS